MEEYHTGRGRADLWCGELGAGYFEVNRKGHLAVRPAEGDPRSLDVKELIDHLVDQRKLQPPILLRFPTDSHQPIEKAATLVSRRGARIQLYGAHYGVFPMKVNPRREVVEEFLREGGKHNFGLNAARRPNFMPRCPWIKRQIRC